MKWGKRQLSVERVKEERGMVAGSKKIEKRDREKKESERV
jgi:hypothetical protein